MLDGIDLYEVSAALFRTAGLLTGPTLRSLEAIHLAASVQIGVDAVLTYDIRMQAAASGLGLRVLAPA